MGKLLLLIFGGLAVLASIILLFSGAVMLWVSGLFADEDGFWMSDTFEVSRDSYAIVANADDLEVEEDALWWLGRIVILKVEGGNENSSKQIFIGIAETADVNDYLADSDRDVIVEFDTECDEVVFEKHNGTAAPELPTSKSFWEVMAYGNGMQTVTWEHEVEDYALVLMNADGAKDIDARMAFGVRVPFVGRFGVGLLIAGVVSLLVGALMLFLGLRKPGVPKNTTPQATATVNG